jgi:hypothetical protein
MLNTPSQTSIHPHPTDGYLFVGAIGQGRWAEGISSKDITEWTEDQIHTYRDLLFGTVSEVEKWMLELQRRGKGCFYKEHVSWIVDPDREIGWLEQQKMGADARREERADPQRTSDTVLPDALLLQLRPTFLIRHPALAFPSLTRASGDVLEAQDAQFFANTYHWSRTLYEWYCSNLTDELKRTEDVDLKYPIILDADDVMEPRLVRKYAGAIGLDTSVLQFEWDPISKEELDKATPMVKRLKDTLLASNGVVKTKSSEGIVIEDEKKKWEQEFGKSISDRLAVLVDAAMEDYLWLKERRMRVPMY